MSRQDVWALTAAISCICIFAMVGSLILPTLTLNLEARGESSTIIGVFGAILGLAALIGAPFAPALVRKMGVGRALSMLLVITAIADLSYKIFEDSLMAWFAIYAVSALAIGLVFIISETLITSLAPPARRNFILGIYVTSFALGFATGPVILGFTGIEGWTPFVVAAALAIVAALLVAIANIKKSAVPVAPGAGFFRLFPVFPLPFVCAFALGAAEMSVYDLLPIYARKSEYEVSDAVFLLTVFGIGTLCLQPLVGIAADKFSSRRVLALASCGGVLGAACLPVLVGNGADYDQSVVHIAKLAGIGIWGGLLMAVYPLGLAQAAQIFPKAKLPAVNALFGFSYGGGALFGPALTGVAMDITPHGIAVTLAVFASLPLLSVWTARLEADAVDNS